MNINKNNLLHEELVKFHDQKSGDFNPETNLVNESSQEVGLNNNEIKKTNELSDCVINTVEKINNAVLEYYVKDDVEQAALLKEKKEISKNMIMEVLNKTEEYIHSIEALETLRLDPESFSPQRRAELDDMRRQNHNALIDTIKSTIRFISHTFCQISEKAIDKWHEDLEKRGSKVLEVKRIKLPEKIFLPDNFNFNDRYQITDWAEKIFSELSDIKNDLFSKR